jgi:hypothetical protein
VTGLLDTFRLQIGRHGHCRPATVIHVTEQAIEEVPIKIAKITITTALAATSFMAVAQVSAAAASPSSARAHISQPDSGMPYD